MIRQVRLSTLVLYLGFSGVTYAADRPHHIEFGGNLGTIDKSSDASLRELNDLSTVHSSISYHYQFPKILVVGGGYLTGDSGSVSLISDLFTDSRLEYSTFFIRSEFQTPQYKGHALYLNVDFHQYDYDIIDDDQVVNSDDGKGVGYGFGWKHHFKTNFTLRLSRDYLELGDDISITSLGVHLGYRF